MLAHLTSKMHDTAAPTSREDKGFDPRARPRNTVSGERFHRVSKNQYFQFIDKRAPSETHIEFRDYLMGAQYEPADAEFIEKLKTEYDPKTQAISEMLIRDDNTLCIYDRYVYPLREPDVIIWNNVITEADITAFINAIQPFVEVPGEEPPSEGAPAAL